LNFGALWAKRLAPIANVRTTVFIGKIVTLLLTHRPSDDPRAHDVCLSKRLAPPPTTQHWQNCLENKPKDFGIGDYNEEGFAYMQRGWRACSTHSSDAGEGTQ
jgi:hypothetical protein